MSGFRLETLDDLRRRATWIDIELTQGSIKDPHRLSTLRTQMQAINAVIEHYDSLVIQAGLRSDLSDDQLQIWAGHLSTGVPALKKALADSAVYDLATLLQSLYPYSPPPPKSKYE